MSNLRSAHSTALILGHHRLLLQPHYSRLHRSTAGVRRRQHHKPRAENTPDNLAGDLVARSMIAAAAPRLFMLCRDILHSPVWVSDQRGIRPRFRTSNHTGSDIPYRLAHWSPACVQRRSTGPCSSALVGVRRSGLPGLTVRLAGRGRHPTGYELHSQFLSLTF